MRTGLAIWILLVVSVSCGNKSSKVTRNDCSKVADHMVDLQMAWLVAHPDDLWDFSHAGERDHQIPATTTKATFKQFLESPEGKTWVLKARGWVRTGAELGVDPCVEKANPALVKCLLAAKSRADVDACDNKSSK